MKKTLSAVLISSMLLMPTSVLAADEDNYIHSLRFDKIEDEIEARNPTMEFQREQLWDGSDTLDDQKKLLEIPVQNLEKQYDSLVDQLKNGQFIKIIDMELAGESKKVFIHNGTPFAILLPNRSGIYLLDNATEPNSPTISDVGNVTTFDEVKNELDGTVSNLINYNDYLNYNLLKLYSYQLTSLQGTLKSLDKQRDNLWKSYLQIDMAEDQLVWGAQQLYLAYYGLSQTKANLQTNIEMLQKKLTIQQLRVSLGLATQTDGLSSEIQIKELNMTLDKLNQSMNDIKGQLNVMLGQDFDTELNLSEPSYATQNKLRAMDYEEDLEDALNQSYNVRLKDDSEEIEDAERSFTLAFHQAYQDVQDKTKALELEKLKLDNEQMKFDHNTLMNTLGLISNIDFEGLRSIYLTQVNKVKTAEQDLLKAYTAYDWMKKGLTVSTGTGASGGSSAPSTTAPTGTTGTSSSGMGF